MTHPGGRPTDYDESFCDKVVELGALGKSTEQIAKELGFALRTIYLWKDTYPQFMQALSTAKELEQAWWEDQCQAYMLEYKDGPKLNATLWSRSMAARFPKKYRDNSKVELTGENGAPLLAGLQVTFVKPNDT
jgi:hypothetical protein